MVVAFRDGQLTFRNTANSALNALAFGEYDIIWKDDETDRRPRWTHPIAATAISNTSDKRPVQGATSAGIQSYESALWTIEDVVDAFGRGCGTVKELRAKWINADYTSTKETLFAPYDSQHVLLNNDNAKMNSYYGVGN